MLHMFFKSHDRILRIHDQTNTLPKIFGQPQSQAHDTDQPAPRSTTEQADGLRWMEVPSQSYVMSIEFFYVTLGSLQASLYQLA